MMCLKSVSEHMRGLCAYHTYHVLRFFCSEECLSGQMDEALKFLKGSLKNLVFNI